jgi:cell division GTPase FtsZ
MKTLLNISLVLNIIFLSIIIYLVRDVNSSKVDNLKKENIELNKKLDTLLVKKNDVDFKLTTQQTKIDSLKKVDSTLGSKYQFYKKEAEKIKKSHEKNSKYNNFTSPDIIKYFTDSI